ncbi:phosphotransferase [Pseudomonas sp. NPDC089407]|uniref:phosphotransferase n=1 Tax=Pseudomonas sp. NPDC089407 TaxID=3364464 RepID=UPI00384FE659
MPDQVLAAAPAQATDSQAEALASQFFGLNGRAKLLTGERDLNFHFACSDGRQFLLKISNPAEDPHVVDFQNKAMLHIERTDPTLEVQRVFPNLEGGYQIAVSVNGDTTFLRLFSFVEGIPLAKVRQPTLAIRSALGVSLARLGIALRGFFHPAAGHELLWDIKHSLRAAALIDAIEDPEDRALAVRFLENFEKNAYPSLPGLRAQVIHNDLNFHNVIVDTNHHDHVRNILDFGDMVHAPLVNDLAVASAYHLGSESNALSQALPFIAAYNSVLPLERIEQEILYDLIAARLVLTVAITNWRASLYPENRTYIMRNAPVAWQGLRGFSKISRAQAQDHIARICSKEL